MKVIGANIYLASIDRLHPVLVEILTDEGIAGVGEAAIAYGIGGTAAAGMIKDLFEAVLLGKDPFRIEQLWSDMYDHSFWAKGGVPSSSPECRAGAVGLSYPMWGVTGTEATICS